MKFLDAAENWLIHNRQGIVVHKLVYILCLWVLYAMLFFVPDNVTVNAQIIGSGIWGALSMFVMMSPLGMPQEKDS